MGPLQLTDETSLDLAAKIAKATKAAMGNEYPDGDLDDLVFWMNDLGRYGRKAGKGFFDYDEKGKRLGYWQGMTDKFPHAEDQPDIEDVKNRLMMAQALEAVRALEAGVLEDIREGDVGAILGWGFAPWSGGPFSWLDILGAKEAVRIADDLAARHGERFMAPQMLRDMADQGRSFYGQGGKAAA